MFFRDHGGPGGPGLHGPLSMRGGRPQQGRRRSSRSRHAGTVKSISGSDITIDESVGKAHYKAPRSRSPPAPRSSATTAKASLSDIKQGDDIRVIASSEQTIVIAEDPRPRKQERRQLRKMFRGGGGPWDITARPPALPPQARAPTTPLHNRTGSFSY